MKEEQLPQKPKAAGYARVSSKEQEETGYSLPAQEKLFTDYSANRGFEIKQVFSISESASGAKQRKVFHDMMLFMQKHKINILVCEKVDRLTRNLKDAVVVNDWLEADPARQVHFVKQNLVIHENSKSDEKFRWDIEIVLAKKYISNLSEEVKKGQKEKLAQGWLPSKPPIGYKTIGDKGHKIHVIDEEKAPIVKKMFELYASGQYSTKRLTEIMIKQGLRTTTGNKIGHSRVHQILGDPFFYGMNRWNGSITQGQHEPLIAKELFQHCQEIMHGRKTPTYYKHNPLFKGVFRCKECGGRITWEIQKGHWYGHCNHYKNCTQTEWIKQTEIDTELVNYIFATTPPDERISELLGWVQDALKESHSDEIAFRGKGTAELERQYQMSLQRLDKLYDDKIDGRINQEWYDRKFAQYKKEQEEIMDGLNRHKNANLNYYEVGVAILNVVLKARKMYLNPERTVEEKRTLISLLFEAPKIDNGKIEISYRKPYNVVHQRLQELLLLEKTRNKKFEPPKKPTNKEKSAALGDTCPVLLPN